MPNDLFLPITEPAEVQAFLRTLPLAVDAEGFARFVLGFPHRYLRQTPPVELVRHYALMASLASRAAISSLARDGEAWKLGLVARDRKFLFSRIAGMLSCFGMDIARAEAFANANSLVLDTFVFADRERHFEDDAQRRRFQALLEDVVEGKVRLEPSMRQEPVPATAPEEALTVAWDPAAHPSATRVVVEGPDRFGLLYMLSRAIAEDGDDIEMAYIETPGTRVRDEFYLTRKGAALTPARQQELGEKLAHAGRHARAAPAPIPAS